MLAKAIPTATLLNRLGKKIIERKNPLVFILEERKVPNNSPNTTLRPLVKNAYNRVFLNPIFKDGSLKKVMKFSKPINSQSVNVHHVILKKKDKIVGNRNNIPYIRAAGIRNVYE